MRSYPRLLTIPLVFAATLAGGTALFAQDVKNAETGVPHDWSHHNVVFSNPGTTDQAIEEGRYGDWLKIVSDPRLQLQRMKREAAAKANLNPGQLLRPAEQETRAETQESEMLEGSEEVSRAEIEESVPVGEEKELFRRRPRPRPRPRPRRFSNNLQKDWRASMGASSNAVENTYPAKYSFSLNTANCGNATSPDFVAIHTGVQGSTTQASVIAFDNLYTGCTGIVPSTYWAYNTGGQAQTSVVLSADGSQVAFTQDAATTADATLVILKWAAGTGTAGAPVTLTSTPAASYRACVAPCMTTFTYSATASNNLSSVYYDYSSDTAFVGENSGKLHKFTGVFNGTPAEAGSPWPVTVSTQRLSSPVYDPVTSNVFVGDLSLTGACGTTCGFLYSVNSSTGTVVKSAQLDFVFGTRGGLLLDPVAGKVYAFVGADAGGPSSPCGANIRCSGVFQFPTNFVANASGTEAALTLGSGRSWVNSGTFDNAYFTSSNAASPTGHLYVVGGTGADDNTLYQIPITSGVMGTPVRGPALSNNNSAHGVSNMPGHSVSEIFTGSHDYIFTGVTEWGAPAACAPASATNGCAMGFDVTSGTITTTTTATGASSEPSVPEGFIIDNIATSPAGTSNIYYTAGGISTPCGTAGGCLVQNSQTSP
jgi:hypothetical protein